MNFIKSTEPMPPRLRKQGRGNVQDYMATEYKVRDLTGLLKGVPVGSISKKLGALVSRWWAEQTSNQGPEKPGRS